MENLDKAYGCIYGALVGDASGAYLEFCKKEITPKMVEKALTMPGGGALCIGPGQVTDDGEMTIALLTAIPAYLASSLIDRNHLIVYISQNYIKWFKSNPFDRGVTTQRPMLECMHLKGNILPDAMINFSKKVNVHSKANGALMRCTPIGVYGGLCGLSVDEVATLARLDSSLTHSNETCTDCSAVYSIAISHLVRHPGDAVGAINIACQWAKENACSEVQAFLHDALSWEGDDIKIDCEKNIGFVKHGFTLAFHYLHRQVPLMESYRMTLQKGGDTDTNACIVGGLLGAFWGMSAIPSHMLYKLKTYEFDANHADGNGYGRPDWLHPKNVHSLIEYISSHCESKK